jgi:hypothetical protein
VTRAGPAISHPAVTPGRACYLPSGRDAGPGLLSPAGVGPPASGRAGSGRWAQVRASGSISCRRGLLASPSRIPAVALNVDLLHPCRAPMLGNGRSCVRIRGASRRWAADPPSCRIRALTGRPAGRSLAA